MTKKKELTPAEQLKKLVREQENKKHEIKFNHHWHAMMQDEFSDLPAPIHDIDGSGYEFSHEQGYRADFCWLEPYSVIVEIDGGEFSVGKDGQKGGGHNRPGAMTKDRERDLVALQNGFMVIRLTSKMLSERTILDHLRTIAAVLRQRRMMNQAVIALNALHAVLEQQKGVVTQHPDLNARTEARRFVELVMPHLIKVQMSEV